MITYAVRQRGNATMTNGFADLLSNIGRRHFGRRGAVVLETASIMLGLLAISGVLRRGKWNA